jgi:hypothetical protein
MSSQQQPEDQSADDQEEGDGPDGAGSDEPEKPSEDERIEELTEHIEKARAQAEDAGVLGAPDEEEEFADNRATPSEDDQTIAPPG